MLFRGVDLGGHWERLQASRGQSVPCDVLCQRRTDGVGWRREVPSGPSCAINVRRSRVLQLLRAQKVKARWAPVRPSGTQYGACRASICGCLCCWPRRDSLARMAGVTGPCALAKYCSVFRPPSRAGSPRAHTHAHVRRTIETSCLHRFRRCRLRSFSQPRSCVPYVPLPLRQASSLARSWAKCAKTQPSSESCAYRGHCSAWGSFSTDFKRPLTASVSMSPKAAWNKSGFGPREVQRTSWCAAPTWCPATLSTYRRGWCRRTAGFWNL